MCMNTFIIILITLLLCVIVHGDVYMNQPRGSNNKLNEVSDNVRNDNRLFDSQNNAAAGYQRYRCNTICIYYEINGIEKKTATSCW